jgi:broad specificity phosphatase PhoE
MTAFLLMRHAQPDFSIPDQRKGWGRDLAPLTDSGEEQVRCQLGKIRECSPQIVISSPLTRAVHSASIVVADLQVPFKVEFELHEWIPDMTYQQQSFAEVQILQAEFEGFNGEWPLGETRPWETVSRMRGRALSVLRKYLNYDRILVVSHGTLIKAVTGVSNVELAGLVPFELKDL